MPNFEELFPREGNPKIQYNGKTLQLLDEIEVTTDIKSILLSIESTKSEYLQGVVVKIDKGKLQVGNKVYRKGLVFWEDEMPEPVRIDLKGNPRQLMVSNCWRLPPPDFKLMFGESHVPNKAVQDHRSVDRWRLGHAFYYEDDGPVRRYFCNDLDPDDDFDDIIFTIQLLHD